MCVALKMSVVEISSPRLYQVYLFFFQGRVLPVPVRERFADAHVVP